MHVVGGLTKNDDPVNLVDVYDPEAREWRHDLRKVPTGQILYSKRDGAPHHYFSKLKYRLIVKK